MKRIIKILSIFLCGIIVLWSGMVITDYLRTGNLQEPVFAVQHNEDGCYSGLGYAVTVKRTENGNALEYTEMIMFGKVVSAAIACY